MEPREVDEIRFVRDVVRSGLGDAQTAWLFDQLPRPLAFDPEAVAYSFSLGWVMARTDPEPEPFDVIAEFLEAWLEERLDAGDVDSLTELRDRVEELLAMTGTETEETPK